MEEVKRMFRGKRMTIQKLEKEKDVLLNVIKDFVNSTKHNESSSQAEEVSRMPAEEETIYLRNQQIIQPIQEPVPSQSSSSHPSSHAQPPTRQLSSEQILCKPPGTIILDSGYESHTKTMEGPAISQQIQSNFSSSHITNSLQLSDQQLSSQRNYCDPLNRVMSDQGQCHARQAVQELTTPQNVQPYKASPHPSSHLYPLNQQVTCHAQATQQRAGTPAFQWYAYNSEMSALHKHYHHQAMHQGSHNVQTLNAPQNIGIAHHHRQQSPSPAMNAYFSPQQNHSNIQNYQNSYPPQPSLERYYPSTTVSCRPLHQSSVLPHIPDHSTQQLPPLQRLPQIQVPQYYNTHWNGQSETTSSTLTHRHPSQHTTQVDQSQTGMQVSQQTCLQKFQHAMHSPGQSALAIQSHQQLKEHHYDPMRPWQSYTQGPLQHQQTSGFIEQCSEQAPQKKCPQWYIYPKNSVENKDSQCESAASNCAPMSGQSSRKECECHNIVSLHHQSSPQQSDSLKQKKSSINPGNKSTGESSSLIHPANKQRNVSEGSLYPYVENTSITKVSSHENPSHNPDTFIIPESPSINNASYKSCPLPQLLTPPLTPPTHNYSKFAGKGLNTPCSISTGYDSSSGKMHQSMHSIPSSFFSQPGMDNVSAKQTPIISQSPHAMENMSAKQTPVISQSLHAMENMSAKQTPVASELSHGMGSMSAKQTTVASQLSHGMGSMSAKQTQLTSQLSHAMCSMSAKQTPVAAQLSHGLDSMSAKQTPVPSQLSHGSMSVKQTPINSQSSHLPEHTTISAGHTLQEETANTSGGNGDTQAKTSFAHFISTFGQPEIALFNQSDSVLSPPEVTLYSQVSRTPSPSDGLVYSQSSSLVVSISHSSSVEATPISSASDLTITDLLTRSEKENNATANHGTPSASQQLTKCQPSSVKETHSTCKSKTLPHQQSTSSLMKKMDVPATNKERKKPNSALRALLEQSGPILEDIHTTYPQFSASSFNQSFVTHGTKVMSSEPDNAVSSKTSLQHPMSLDSFDMSSSLSKGSQHETPEFVVEKRKRHNRKSAPSVTTTVFPSEVNVPVKNSLYGLTFSDTTSIDFSEGLQVCCYVCQSQVTSNRIPSHLFFGYLKCLNCDCKITQCCELMSNDSEWIVCNKSESMFHDFSVWDPDPVGFLYYKVCQQFPRKTSATISPECNLSKLCSYLGKLMFLMGVKPWSSALVTCIKYITLMSNPNLMSIPKKCYLSPIKKTRISHENPITKTVVNSAFKAIDEVPSNALDELQKEIRQDSLDNDKENTGSSSTQQVSLLCNLSKQPENKGFQVPLVSRTKQTQDVTKESNIPVESHVQLQISLREEEGNVVTLATKAIDNTSLEILLESGSALTDATADATYCGKDLELAQKETSKLHGLDLKSKATDHEFVLNSSCSMDLLDKFMDYIQVGDQSTENLDVPRSSKASQTTHKTDISQLEIVTIERDSENSKDNELSGQEDLQRGNIMQDTSEGLNGNVAPIRADEFRNLRVNTSLVSHNFPLENNHLVINLEVDRKTGKIDPQEKCPEECPMCYEVLCPSKFYVNICNFNLSTLCDGCGLVFTIVLGKSGSSSKESNKAFRESCARPGPKCKTITAANVSRDLYKRPGPKCKTVTAANVCRDLYKRPGPKCKTVTAANVCRDIYKRPGPKCKTVTAANVCRDIYKRPGTMSKIVTAASKRPRLVD